MNKENEYKTLEACFLTQSGKISTSEVNVKNKFLNRPDIILKACQRMLEEARLNNIDLNNSRISFNFKKD